MQGIIKEYESLENFINQNGKKVEYIKYIFELAESYLYEKKDKEKALFLTSRAKEFIEKSIYEKTKLDIWSFEGYCKMQNSSVPELDLYFEILKPFFLTVSCISCPRLSKYKCCIR